MSSQPPGSCSETKEYYEVILKESIVFLKTNDKRGRGLGSFGTVEEAAVGA